MGFFCLMSLHDNKSFLHLLPDNTSLNFSNGFVTFLGGYLKHPCPFCFTLPQLSIMNSEFQLPIYKDLSGNIYVYMFCITGL